MLTAEENETLTRVGPGTPVMLTEMLRREIEKVARNLDPMNVIRDPDHPIIDTKMDASLLAEKAGSVTYHLPASR
jgi:hypothetical protein